MGLLNTADNVKLGTTQVERVYRGTALVWQHVIPVVCSIAASSTLIDSGQSLTLTATLDRPAATGTVKFRSGSPTGTVVATDTAAPWTAVVSPTQDTVYYAEYVGNHPYLPDTSDGIVVDVAGVTSLTLAASKTDVAQGTSTTLTATIPGVTKGTVNFRTGSAGGPIVSTKVDSPWTYTVTPTADITYYAEYVGNAEQMGSISNAVPINFYIPTSTTLSASKTSFNKGDAAITLTAVVAGISTGTVNFRSGSPTGTIVATDTTAPWTASITPTADTTYYAEYVGSGDYAQSVSTGVAIDYSIPTSISLAVSDTTPSGEAITLTATVTGATTGTVNFRSGSATGTIVGTDTASPWTASVTPTADTTYYAEYVANGDYLGSTSAGVAVDYHVPTTITLTASPTSINNGASVTLTATMTGGATGTVNFRSGSVTGSVVGTDTASPWTATVKPTADTTYYATYAKQGNFDASNSAGKAVEVKQLVTKTWSGYATWTQCYNGSGAAKSGDLYYGYYSSNNGNQRSMFGFAIPDLRSTVAVTGVRIKFYNAHHYMNSGGTIPVGLHESASEPGSYCCSYENLQHLGNAPKPGWVDNWMNSNFTARVKASLIKGFTLGPGPDNSNSYYGYATADSPYMEITYQVWE